MDIFILQSLFPFQNGCILLDKNRLKEYGVTAKALLFGLSTQDVAQAPKYVCSLSLCPLRLAALHSAAFTLLWVTTAHTTRPKGAGFSQQQKPPSRDYTLYWCRNTPTIQLSPALKEHCCKITIASSWSLHPHLPWERVKLQSVEAHPAAPLAAVGNANPPRLPLAQQVPNTSFKALLLCHTSAATATAAKGEDSLNHHCWACGCCWGYQAKPGKRNTWFWNSL